MSQSPHRSQRATVLVSVVLAMVVVQLAVLGAAFLGSREISLTTTRVQGARAFYACEGGANMAMRELQNSVDYDADGKIGGVSDDANSANNPTLGTATFVGVLTTSGATTTITITATAMDAQRTIVMDLQ